MTVLNRPSDGLFNILIILVHALVNFGPMSRDDLVDLCRAGDNEDPARLRQTLKRWTDLGLFSEDDETVALAPSESSEGLTSDPNAVTAKLPGALRRIVFREENNARFWDSERSLCADLTRGLAWLLAQDIYTTSLANHEAVQLLEARQLPDPERQLVQNDVRWQGLRAWGSYLGFLWNSDAPIIDPTAAIRQDLPLIFGPNTELTAADLHERTATILPVLDDGRYRTEVENALNPTSWQRPARQDLLSTALSRALWRLDDQGVLALKSRDDAATLFLQRAGGQEWRSFTHARLIRKEAEPC